MMLSVGVSQVALADGQPLMVVNNSREVVQFQAVRDGQVMDQCRTYQASVCALQAGILPEHRNEIVVRNDRGDVITAAEVQDVRQRVVLGPDNVIHIECMARK